MKTKEKDSEKEYILEKEKPFEALIKIDTLIILAIIFFILLFIKAYILVPIIFILILFATLQTVEENFKITINKKSKEIKIFRYYMGRWKVKEITYKGENYAAVQVEKMVTSLREDGRFIINLLTETTDSEKPGETIVLLENLDLEDIIHAKTISFILGILYETRIKYRAGLIE